MSNDSHNGVYEMFWDCSSCGTRKLLGVTHRYCPHCGSPQDPESRYFPPDSEKVAVEHHELVGRDLTCGACGTPNSRKANNCLSCGRSLESQTQAVVRDDVITVENGEFSGQSLAGLKAQAREDAGIDADSSKPAKWRKSKWAAGTSAVGGVAALMLWSTPAEVTVVSHKWSRNIVVERFGPIDDADWCDEIPARADHIRRSSKVRDHEKVADGQECKTRRVDNGDGSYTQKRECKTKYRKEPIYDDWCKFSVDRWTTDRTEESTGISRSTTPRWPTVQLSKTGSCIGCEREGNRSERYTVIFQGEENRQHSCTFNQTRWQRIEPGTRYSATVGVLNRLDCGSLQRLDGG